MIERSLRIERGVYSQLKWIASLERLPIAAIIRRALWQYVKGYNFPEQISLDIDGDQQSNN